MARPDRRGASVDLQGPRVGGGQAMLGPLCFLVRAAEGPHGSAICRHHNVLPKVNVKGPWTETLETRSHNKPVFYFNFRLVLSQVL